MTPAARIAATIELLDAMFATERPADGVASAYFRSRRFIGAKDRGAIAERVYAVLRHRARLTWWLDRAGHIDRGGRGLTIAHLALVEQMSVAALTERFCGGRFGPAPLEAAELRLTRAVEGHTVDHPAMPRPVRTECPDWAAAPLQAAFGDRFEVELAALLDPAPLDLRVNEIRGMRDEVRAALAAGGIPAEPTPLSPLGLRILGRPPLAHHPLFRNGIVEVQDEGSQLVALLTDARPGQQVADFCAGAGGKALALAARMRGKGRVVACDVSEGRLIRARERLRRAGIDNVEPRLLSGEADKWIKRQKGKFDRVLVDAPCSGSGAWRRNPDARWRPIDLGSLTALQGRLLASAARLVKPGGRLVYATCSLLPDENEDRIAAFLDGHPEFRPVAVRAVWAEAVGTPCPAGGPLLHLTPARHGTDGFFVAILERLPVPSAGAASTGTEPVGEESAGEESA